MQGKKISVLTIALVFLLSLVVFAQRKGPACSAGKTASGSIDGNKESGTVTVTTEQGTKTAEYGNREKPGARLQKRLRTGGRDN